MRQAKLAENTDIVRVKRDELLTVLEQNKIKHVKEYNIAIDQFRKDVIEETKKLLENNISGGTLKFGLTENTRVPLSYEKEYNTIIRKYTMSVDEEIFLNDTQFSQYVMDDWQWKHTLSNAYYSDKSAGLMSSQKRMN